MVMSANGTTAAKPATLSREPEPIDRYIANRINAVLAVNRGVVKTADRNIRAFPLATSVLAEVARSGTGAIAAFATTQLARTALEVLGVLPDEADSLESAIEVVQASDARLLATWSTFQAGLPAVVFTGE
jgi:hypothetical protein